MLGIADPVVDPLVRRLVADVLERLTERAPRADLRSFSFAHPVTALAADGLADLFAAFRVAVWRGPDRKLVRFRIAEQIRDDRVDFNFVADRIFRRAVIRVVPEARHPRGR